MKIIISPAKKMVVDSDNFPVTGRPVFEAQAKKIHHRLLQLSYKDLQELWKCNEQLTEENRKRLREMDFDRALTPAILSYVGLQYQHMSAITMTRGALTYVEKNVRILSGFYGLLKPFDGILPYRLEMQAKLSLGKTDNLYDFWKDSMYQEIAKEDHLIINLASKENSKVIEPFVKKPVQLITIVFGELVEGKVIQKATIAKMARGEMVRFLAENQIENIEFIKKFSWDGFEFDEKRSSDDLYFFIQKKFLNKD